MGKKWNQITKFVAGARLMLKILFVYMLKLGLSSFNDGVPLNKTKKI
jgi:hypothetical protein